VPLRTNGLREMARPVLLQILREVDFQIVHRRRQSAGGEAMSDKTNRPAYVGFKSCGCAVAACVDGPEYAKETAKTLSEWVRGGLTIERKTVGWVRENLHFCSHNKQEALPL